jgi:uncharacterized protein YjiS (DUF1127 family)
MNATPMTSLRIQPGHARPAARPAVDRGGGGLSITPGDIAGALLKAVAVWRERARQRRQLAAMDDYLLKDIGLTRADVDHEAGKPFWRP